MALLRKELAKESGALASLGGAGEAVSRLLRGGQSFNHQSAGEALRLLDAGAEHAAGVLVHGRRDLARVEHDGGARRPGDADAVLDVVDEDLELALLLLLYFQRGVEVRVGGEGRRSRGVRCGGRRARRRLAAPLQGVLHRVAGLVPGRADPGPRLPWDVSIPFPAAGLGRGEHVSGGAQGAAARPARQDRAVGGRVEQPVREDDAAEEQ